jgi:hypothetical protein
MAQRAAVLSVLGDAGTGRARIDQEDEGRMATQGMYGTDRTRGELSGWGAFAGTLLAIAAMLNVVYGIGAIDNANFYLRDAKFVISDLNVWGWILVGLGVLQFCAAVSIFAGTSWGRWVGVATAGLNAIAQMLFIPSAPFLALALFAVDILVIYGLIAHVGPSRRA